MAFEITLIDRAWAAGLWEGEGCFTLKKQRWAIAEINMTDEDVIKRFGAIVGFGSVTGPYAKPLGHKPAWRWGAGGFEATQMLVAMLWPWLGARRRERAAEVLTASRAAYFTPSAVCRRGHAFTPENTMYRDYRATMGQRSKSTRYRRARVCRACIELTRLRRRDKACDGVLWPAK